MTTQVFPPGPNATPDEIERWREEISAGYTQNVIVNPPTGGDGDIDPATGKPVDVWATPPAPTSFSATATFNSVILEWVIPNLTYVQYTELYRGTVDNIDDAGTEIVATLENNNNSVNFDRVWTDNPPDPAVGATYYYWIRFLNSAGTPGPLYQQAGVSAVLPADPSYLLEQLADSIGYDQFDVASGVFPVRVGTVLPTLPDADWPAGSSFYLTTTGKMYTTKDGTYWTISNRPATFYTSMDNQQDIDSWVAVSGTTPHNFLVSTATTVGGGVMDIGDDSGNDEVRLEWQGDLIPYNPDKVYKLSAVLRQALATGTPYTFVGVVGYAKDGVTKINTGGIDSYSSAHYVCVSAEELPVGTTVTRSGYFTGHGAYIPGGTNDLNTPSGLYAGITYIRPFIIANFNAQAGRLYVDEVSIEIQTEAGASNIVADSITTGKIAAGAIVASHVGTNEIIANSANIKDAVVVEAKIGNAAITNAKIGSLAVSTAKIQDLAVTNAKIGLLAVDTAQIATAAIETAKINNAAITEAKIGTAAVTNAKIGTAAITAAKIGTAEVDSLKIAGNACTVPSASYTAGDIDVSGTSSWTTVASLALNTADEGGTAWPVSLICSMEVEWGDSGTSDFQQVEYRIRNSTTGAVLYGPGTTMPYGQGNVREIQVAMTVSHTPTAGTKTYTMEARVPSTQTGDTALCRYRSIVAIGTIR